MVEVSVGLFRWVKIWVWMMLGWSVRDWIIDVVFDGCYLGSEGEINKFLGFVKKKL